MGNSINKRYIFTKFLFFCKRITQNKINFVIDLFRRCKFWEWYWTIIFFIILIVAVVLVVMQSVFNNIFSIWDKLNCWLEYRSSSKRLDVVMQTAEYAFEYHQCIFFCSGRYQPQSQQLMYLFKKWNVIQVAFLYERKPLWYFFVISEISISKDHQF